MTATLDRKLEFLTWLKYWRETNNKPFQELYFSEARYLVLCGGAGSGKSIFAGRKVLDRVTSEPGHSYLICRKVLKSIKNSCFKQLISQANEHHTDAGMKINKSDMKLTFANGSEIIFVGLDDVEKLKSIFHVTGIWIEEASELLESDYDQLDIRLRDETVFYKQMILSFNPISVTHWLKRRFFDKPNIEAQTHRSTYKDNRFLPEESRAVLERFRDTSPYYYQVYCLGEWGVTGNTVFNAQHVHEQREALQKADKPERGSYMAGKWLASPDGIIEVYAQPEPGHAYVIGGDTAGTGSDSFAAQVVDIETFAQVARLHMKNGADAYVEQVEALSKRYNNALAAIEANYDSYPLRELDKRGVPQYVREQTDTYTGKLQKAFGFVTSSKTRPMIISEGIALLNRLGYEIINDLATLAEMDTFVYNDNFRPEAVEGEHDDLIMALIIAYHAAESGQAVSGAAQGVDKSLWSRSMIEDYNNAGSAAEQAALAKEFGAQAKRAEELGLTRRR